MNRKGTVILPILIGLVILFLILAAGASYFYQQEHVKNIQLQTQIDELNATVRITEGKLDETKKAAAEFQLKLQEAKAQVDKLTNELTLEKSAHLETSNKFDQITLDLEQQKKSRQDLESKLSQSEADGKKIRDQIKIITQEKKDLETKIKDLESGANGVELGKVVVNSDNQTVNLTTKEPEKFIANRPVKIEKGEASQVKPLEGKVSVVNKEFNFVVINLGSKDGVKLSDEFEVSRGGVVIGNIKVEKVHEAMSAAGFVPDLKDRIKENDLVQKVK